MTGLFQGLGGNVETLAFTLSERRSLRVKRSDMF